MMNFPGMRRLFLTNRGKNIKINKCFEVLIRFADAKHFPANPIHCFIEKARKTKCEAVAF
jgi:hypothetical protein